MIVGTLINSALSYMSVFHFQEAMKCVDFILDQYLKDPEIYFRKAQIVYFNKVSTFTDLEKALESLQNLKHTCKPDALRKEKDPGCVLCMKPQKMIVKYKELESKILTEIDKRLQDNLKLISIFLKRSEKLIQ